MSLDDEGRQHLLNIFVDHDRREKELVAVLLT